MKMEYLCEVLPKDLVLIVEDYAKDRTNYDNYDKVMQQLLAQSSVFDYGFWLTFRKGCHFRSKFFSILDEFSDWSSSGLYCNISDPVMNCIGKLTVDGTTAYRPKKGLKRGR